MNFQTKPIYRLRAGTFKVLLSGLVIAGVSQFVQAQSNESKKDSLVEIQPVIGIYKTNLLPVLWGDIPFTGEYQLGKEIVTGKQTTAQINVSYLGNNPFINSVLRYSGTSTPGSATTLVAKGFRFQVSYRYYLPLKVNGLRYAPGGFYISPHFSYSRARVALSTANDYYYMAGKLTTDLLCGMQLIAGPVAFDFFGGLGIKHLYLKYHTPNYYRSIPFDSFFLFPNPVRIVAGCNIGIVHKHRDYRQARKRKKLLEDEN